MVHLLLAAVALLPCMAHIALGAGCIDSSTVMFGAPWQPSFTVEEQETHYRQHGGLSQVTLYFNLATGCVAGIRGSYGWASSVTDTLGVDFDNTADSSTLVAQELQLPQGEYIDNVEYKVGSCIEYLKFATNAGNTLQIGNSESPNSLQSSKPAPGSYLGFFKGTVDPPVSITEESELAVPLQQLQLVWVASECSNAAAGDEAVIPAAAGIDSAAAANRLRIVTTQGQPARSGNTPRRQGNLRVAQGPPAAAAAAAAPTEPTVLEAPVPGILASADNSTAEQSNEGTAVTSEEDDTEQHQAASGTPAAAAATTMTNAADSAAIVDTAQASSGTATTAAAAMDTTAAAASSGSAAAAVCVPKGCADGVCATSSCAMNGMGRDVPALLCFGTNIMPRLLMNQNNHDICSNLACKLTKPNCTSTGLSGLGGFCMGRVVAMGATAELHESGKALIGYPCLEHRGLITEMVTKFGDYSAKGTYVSKAWKVCDCAAGGIDAEDSSRLKVGNLVDMEFSGHNNQGGATEIKVTTPTFNVEVPDVTATLARVNVPAMPDFGVNVSSFMAMLEKPLINMTTPDVVIQWMSAFADRQPVLNLNVTDAKINALKALIPGFSAPCILVPNISASLLRIPITIELPSFTIPERMFPTVALLLPNITNTSLPSMVVPHKIPAGIRIPNALNIRNISTPNLYDTMESFFLKLPDYNFNIQLPQMPNFGAGLLGKAGMDVLPDVLSQWVSGIMTNMPVPRMQVPDRTLSKLQKLIPQMPQLPALITFEASSPWFDQNPDLMSNISSFVVPDKLTQAVRKLMPGLGSLPTILEAVKSGPTEITIELPEITVPQITVPSFKQQLAKILARMPANPAAQNDQVNFISQMTDGAGSLGAAVQQMLGKQKTNRLNIDLPGLDMGPSSSSAAAAAPTETATPSTPPKAEPTVAIAPGPQPAAAAAPAEVAAGGSAPQSSSTDPVVQEAPVSS